MEGSPELQERTLECSGQIVLGCGCGEKLILLGLEEDWRSELAPLVFECRCGQGPTLDAAEAVPSEGLGDCKATAGQHEITWSFLTLYWP